MPVGFEALEVIPIVNAEQTIKKGERIAGATVRIIDGISKNTLRLAVFMLLVFMVAIVALCFFGYRTITDMRTDFRNGFERIAEQMKQGDKEIVDAIKAGDERRERALLEMIDALRKR